MNDLCAARQDVKKKLPYILAHSRSRRPPADGRMDARERETLYSFFFLFMRDISFSPCTLLRFSFSVPSPLLFVNLAVGKDRYDYDS